jgi:nitroreductase
MTASSPDHKTVFAAVELANHAPSVHNTQPWRWLAGNHSVHLMASSASWDVLLGCGAALHHLQVAFAALGWGTAVHRIPNEHDLDHLAAVALHPRVASPAEVALAGTIVRRRSYRRRLTSWEVPAPHLDLMADAAARAGALLVPVTDGAVRRLLTPATGAADQRRLELAAHGGRSRWHDPRPEEPDPPDGELLVVATPGDDPLSLLNAGEATSAALLAATDVGLATCPLSQPLEAADTRAAVREHVLDGVTHPQLVLRVGWASVSAPPLPNMPVRRTEDTIDYLPGTHKPVHP